MADCFSASVAAVAGGVHGETASKIAPIPNVADRFIRSPHQAIVRQFSKITAYTETEPASNEFSMESERPRSTGIDKQVLRPSRDTKFTVAQPSCSRHTTTPISHHLSCLVIVATNAQDRHVRRDAFKPQRTTRNSRSTSRISNPGTYGDYVTSG